LSDLCLANADSLMNALRFCRDHGIGDFRINSQILPLKTHPETGYDIMDLPDGDSILRVLSACGRFCRDHDIRTGFHPDQFIVLSSPHTDVVARSIADLEYQAQVAEWVNADVINIHGGGVYGDKPAALERLRRQIGQLSDPVRKRLTLENDDKSYTPQDLLPVCEDMEVPMVYDVHHHRCAPDGLSVDQASDLAVKTWNREPMFHVSSPINGWKENDIRKHHDYIDIRDFPEIWQSIGQCLDLTVEVEAKAKELAVLRLKKALSRQYE
jgi:UV DNA damage endonuclease